MRVNWCVVSGHQGEAMRDPGQGGLTVGGSHGGVSAHDGRGAVGPGSQPTPVSTRASPLPPLLESVVPHPRGELRPRLGTGPGADHHAGLEQSASQAGRGGQGRLRCGPSMEPLLGGPTKQFRTFQADDAAPSPRDPAPAARPGTEWTLAHKGPPPIPVLGFPYSVARGTQPAREGRRSQGGVISSGCWPGSVTTA